MIGCTFDAEGEVGRRVMVSSPFSSMALAKLGYGQRMNRTLSKTNETKLTTEMITDMTF